jgi:tRNA A37 threonylcarbamoyladenosine dehydratase
MQKKCAKCGKSIKEVGKLVKVTWLGRRAPLCKKCRTDLKKKKEPKGRFGIPSVFGKMFSRGKKKKK